jgi:5-formyltetrahydrofolate cyclo-ligase
MQDLLNSKAVLRKTYFARRKQLSLASITQQSELICQAFFACFDLSKTRYLHIFLAIPEKGEVDTQLIIQRIWRQYPHIQLVSSQTNLSDNTLSHYELNRDTPLRKNDWGINEPSGSAQVFENQLDIVLIPLLCLDKLGYRVGYGKGFYDRFLANCRKDALKIGLSFFDPIEKIIDVNDLDIPLNYCLVNEQLWQFGG